MVDRYIVDELKARNGFSPITPVVRASDYDALESEAQRTYEALQGVIGERVELRKRIRELETALREALEDDQEGGGLCGVTILKIRKLLGSTASGGADGG